MATVPTYDGPQVRSEAMPGVRFSAEVSPNQYGGIASGLDRAAALADQVRQHADDIAVTAADTAALDFATKRKMAADEKRGSDAFGEIDSGLSDYDKQVGEIANSITSPVARHAFEQRAARRRVEFGSGLHQHVARERGQYDTDTVNGNMATELASAAANYRDPNAVRISMIRASGEYARYADRNGVAPEARDLRLAELRSSFHATVIEKLVDDGFTGEAKAYFDANGADLTEKDAKGIRGAVREGNDRTESMAFVDGMLTEINDDGDLMPLDAGMRRIAETFTEPEQRERVERRWRDMYNVHRAARDERYDGAFQKADAILADPANIRGLDAIPESLMTTLRPRDRKTLEASAAKRALGQEPPRKSLRYLALLQQAGTNPEAFKKEQLLDYLPEMAREDIAELQKAQNDMRTGNGKSDEMLSGVRTRSGIVTDLLQATGGDMAGKGVDPAVVDKFYGALDARVIAEESATNKKASPTEIRAWAEELLAEQVIGKRRHTVRNIIKDSLPFGYLLDDKESDITARTFEADGRVPPDDYAIIIEKMRARGLVPTEAAILETYRRANPASKARGP